MYFHRSYERFLCPTTRDSSNSSAQSMLQPTDYNITTLPRPAANSRQYHARVTDPRYTVSSCFGRNLRSVTHRIYSYQVSLGCCRCSASFGTKPRYNTQQWQQCKEHATASIPVAPSSNRQRHARVADTRCTLSSCFVEPEVRHPSHLSDHLCWCYIVLHQLHVACMHARGHTHPCTARRCPASRC